MPGFTDVKHGTHSRTDTEVNFEEKYSINENLFETLKIKGQTLVILEDRIQSGKLISILVFKSDPRFLL